MRDKIHVCIVEDSSTFLEWLQSDLSVFDDVVVTGSADSVDSAIHLVRLKKPDILILDLWLNDGTGFELLEAIKKIEENPVVYIFTNYPWPTLKDKCAAMGAEGFFEKSSEYFDLIDTVRTFRKEV